jgi:hypothetical protein
MRCAVANERYVWFFEAANKQEGRKIANTILFFEKHNLGNNFSGFSLAKGYWHAVSLKIDDEVRQWLAKINENKIVEIKRQRAPTIDVLYLTRAQKERWSEEEAKNI